MLWTLRLSSPPFSFQRYCKCIGFEESTITLQTAVTQKFGEYSKLKKDFLLIERKRKQISFCDLFFL